MLNLPDLSEKGDVTDWRDQCGGTKDLFLELLSSLGDDEPDPQPEVKQPDEFQWLTSADLDDGDFETSYLVPGILAKQQSCIIGAPQKG